MREAVVSFVALPWPRVAGAATLDIQPIAGGLEASVARGPSWWRRRRPLCVSPTAPSAPADGHCGGVAAICGAS